MNDFIVSISDELSILFLYDVTVLSVYGVITLTSQIHLQVKQILIQRDK